MKYTGPKERVDAARSEKTSIEDLVKLANSAEVFVRAAVACNPNTPKITLDSLAVEKLESEQAWEIAANLAENPSLQTETILKLIKNILPYSSNISPRDYYPNRVIIALSCSGALSQEGALTLSDSENFSKHLRSKMIQENSKRELIEALCNDPSEKIRKRANSMLSRI